MELFHKYNLTHYSRYLLLLAVFYLMTAQFVFSQTGENKKGITHKGNLEIYGSIMKDSTSALQGALYEISENNIKIIEGYTDKKGKFSCVINYNREYKFKVSKPGFISKSVELYTFVPEEWEEILLDFRFLVEMYELIDSSQQKLIKPAGLVMWIDSLESFYWDVNYTLEFKKEQDKLRKKALTLTEQIKLQKELEAKVEADKLIKAAQQQAETDKLSREAEARREGEKLIKAANEQAEAVRLKKEAEANAEAQRLLKEAEKNAQKGILNKVDEEELKRLQKEANAKAAEIRLKKEAEAKAEEERLRIEAEAEAESIRLLKEGEAKAKSIQLMKEAEAGAEAVRLIKAAEAEAESIRLMKEIAAKEKEAQERKATQAEQNKEKANTFADLERQKKISDLQYEAQRLRLEEDAKRETERLKKEAEEKALTQRLQKESEARTETIVILKEAKEKAEKVRTQQVVKTKHTKEILETAAEIERLEKQESNSISTNQIQSLEYKPEIKEELSEGMMKNIKSTIIKYPYKYDTLQEVKYIWGNVYYYKNNESIEHQLYVNELKKVKAN